MYKCEECGNVFDEPKMVQECVGEFWGTPAYETWAVCPDCGSDEIEDYEDNEIDEEAEYERWERER